MKQKTTFIAGNFNILHPGHLRLIRFAKELGNKLIVGVYSDKIAGNLALVPQNLRLESIKSISWVDESFIIDKPLVQIINKIKPDFIVKGKEHEDEQNPESDIIKQYGGRLVFSSGENVFSSFDLIQKEVNTIFRPNIFNPIDFIKRNNIKIDTLLKKINIR